MREFDLLNLKKEIAFETLIYSNLTRNTKDVKITTSLFKEGFLMIMKTIQDDIFDTKAKHVAFAVNTEGYNDSGFAGKVSSQYWSELANCGTQQLGTVLSKEVNGRIFHALVCHSLKEGWGDNQAEIIKECFDKIPANGEPTASIAIGTGFIGAMSGADFRQIVCGMHDSQQQILLYGIYTLDQIMGCYIEEKGKARRK
jgi:hypothetical protein